MFDGFWDKIVESTLIANIRFLLIKLCDHAQHDLLLIKTNMVEAETEN